MESPRSRSRKARSLAELQEKGFTACLVGVVLLLLPFLAGRSGPFAGLIPVLGGLGWMVLAIGIVLLALHRLAKPKASKPEDSREAPRWVAKPRRSSTAQTAHPQRKEPAWAKSARPPAPVDAPRAEATPTRRAQEPATHWSANVFPAIEWRRFEAVCEALFAQAGFETRSQSHGADGGVDIWLHSRNSTNADPVAIVQCKHWQGRAVGVKEMREFYGVMAANQLKRGTYATTASYTPDAQAFAKANGINVLDGAGLLALIAKRTSDEQQALLDVAFEGDYWRPTCASCGIKMVERTPAKGGKPFWGCKGYPRCKSRLPMAADIRQNLL